MGKKSKGKSKSGGKKGKCKSSKQQPKDINDGYTYLRPTFVGDRVWFFLENKAYEDGGKLKSHLHRRGIVKSYNSRTDIEILPLPLLDDGTGRTITADRTIPDVDMFTTRFKPGDKVLCNSSTTGWKLSTVMHSFAIDETEGDLIPKYKCLVDEADTTSAFDVDSCLSVLCDTDECIREYPVGPCRFSVGESVSINPSKTHTLTGEASAVVDTALKSQSWIQGVITITRHLTSNHLLIGKGIRLVQYEIEFLELNTRRRGGARKHKGYLSEDDDEHICRVGSNSRERLLEATRQGCSSKHLQTLASALDISSFQDMITSQAVEHASYNALLWLHHDCGVALETIIYPGKNTILHRIAMCDNSTKFFEIAGRSNCDREREGRTLSTLFSGSFTAKPIANQLNEEGKSFLHILIERRDMRSLDICLSPRVGLAWQLKYMDDAELASLVEQAKDVVSDATPRYIVDAFARFRSLHKLHACFDRLVGVSVSEDELALEIPGLAAFTGVDARHNASLLARFYHDYAGSRDYVDSYSLSSKLVRRGFPRLFQLFYEVDRGIFGGTFVASSRENRDEFIQPELVSKEIRNASSSVDVDIVRALVIGDSRPFYAGDYVSSVLQGYARHICTRYELKEAAEGLSSGPGGVVEVDVFTCITSCLASLRDPNAEQNEFLRQQNEIVDYKLDLLGQSNTTACSGRLQILSFLLREVPSYTKQRLSVVEIVKQRRLPFLQFMIDEKLVSLDSSATEVKDAKQAGLYFLSQERNLSAMTLLEFLILCCVEYDDLQTLVYLLGEKAGRGESLPTYDGVNLLHMAAHFGRIEVAAYLTFSKPSLMTEVCSGRYNNMRAVHIAVSNGHTNLADILLTRGSPIGDKIGKTVTWHGTNSRLKHVEMWSKGREGSIALARDLSKLLKIAASGNETETKGFIRQSKCLDMGTWGCCEAYSLTSPGPRGYDKTYIETLKECCVYLGENFKLWIAQFVFFRQDYGSFLAPNEECGKLSVHDLISNAVLFGLEDLVDPYLRHPSFQDISVKDPWLDNQYLYLLFEIPGVGVPNEMFKDDLHALLKTRKRIMRGIVLNELVRLAQSEMIAVIRKGGSRQLFEDILRAQRAAIDIIVVEEFCDEDYDGWRFRSLQDPNRSLLSVDSYVNITKGESPLKETIYYRNKGNFDFSRVSTALLLESDSPLVESCLINLAGWTAALECQFTRDASHLDLSSKLEICLDPKRDCLFKSSLPDRFESAILGAAEGGRYQELFNLISISSRPVDHFDDDRLEIPDDYRGLDFEKLSDTHGRSLICCIVYGHINGTPSFSDSQRLVRLLLHDLSYSPKIILRSIQSSSLALAKAQHMLMILHLLSATLKNLSTSEIVRRFEEVRASLKIVATFLTGIYIFIDKEGSKDESLDSRLLHGIDEIASYGIDIQQLPTGLKPGFDFPTPGREKFVDGIKELKVKQQKSWEQFKLIKYGSLREIRNEVANGGLDLSKRDRGLTLAVHIAAAYNRVDVLVYLVLEKKMDLNFVDGKGRSVLQVARDAQALAAVDWIVSWQSGCKIKSFVRMNLLRTANKRRLARRVASAVKIQAIYRGLTCRKIHRGPMLLHLDQAKRFSAIWDDSIAALSKVSRGKSWASVREELGVNCLEEDHVYDYDGDQLLTQAMETARLAKEPEDRMCVTQSNGDGLFRDEDVDEEEAEIDSSSCWSHFHISSHAVKFLKRADSKYKSFFIRRMKQLAGGERSRILKKRLSGSKSTIWETYLEQKSGFRLLWTEQGERITIWFVCPHQRVSRCMRLIDSAMRRSYQQQDVVKTSHGDSSKHRARVQLDCFGNTPLKVYDIYSQHIEDIASPDWIPKLHLTEEERGVVEAKGTVLLLGRSGTGKTVCICNRIEFDRQMFAGHMSFSQIFVSRSKKLCRYVEGVVGHHVTTQTHFLTFSELISQIHDWYPQLSAKANIYVSSLVTFERFKSQFYHLGNYDLDPLLVWTAIRSFLIGSIEAFQSPGRILPREHFVGGRLGRNRCRIPSVHRNEVYDIFLRYQRWKESAKLFDDSDRVNILLDLLGSLNQRIHTKIYVDEVQDFTQIEILVFFMLAGPENLFLAGDPAQSVVDGTEFRFEEVRSVGHFVAGERRGLVPQKPLTVNSNFRSHSGILNCAGGFLDLLFEYFPGSAKMLPKDNGLFRGPRPGVCRTDFKLLKNLLRENLNGTVILCHDTSCGSVKRILNYELVYGIKEAKGLEFKSVIVINFFSGLGECSQKPWRNLLLGREGADFESKHPEVGGHLKLLYTAITRSIERLLFVETSPSISGDAAVRWLTKPPAGLQNAFATMSDVNNMDALSLTSDEFVGQGLDNIELAESSNLDMAQRLSHLDKAIYCFEQTQHDQLVSKARLHRKCLQFGVQVVQDGHALEIEAARLTEASLKEGLLTEALHLLNSALLIVSDYTAEELKKRLIAKIEI